MRLNDFTISAKDAVSVAPPKLPPIYDERCIQFELMAVLDVLKGALRDAQRLIDLIDRQPTPRL